MLTQRPVVPSSTFTRRDFRRLGIGAALLVVAMTAIFAIDLQPARLVVALGDVASADIAAPRTLSYPSDVRTEAARAAAVQNVKPVYDYGSQKALRIANAEAIQFDNRVAQIDRAFDPATDKEERDKVLAETISALSEPARATLEALTPERWAVVREQAASTLDRLERGELKDSDLVPTKADLPNQMSANLDQGEAALAAELISPL